MQSEINARRWLEETMQGRVVITMLNPGFPDTVSARSHPKVASTRP